MSIEYISALTALGAVILSPLVAYLSVFYQIKKTVLSTNRQKWIDDLRSAISEYCGLMNSLNQARSLNHLSYQEVYPQLQKSFELESRIALLLNPNEEKHRKISDLTTEGRVSVFGTDDKYNPEIWNEAWYEIISVSSSIFKEEWSRVKELK